MQSQIEQLHQYIFSTQDTLIYAILDGASIPNLLSNLESYAAEHVCLFRGELEPELAQTAPYLVLLKPKTAFTNWILSGFGRHWGIYAESRSSMMEMRKHFRKFIMVYDRAGKPLYFRYYDPRVLRTYLPNCNSEKTQTIFGPVIKYYMEGEEDGSLMCFVATNEKPVSKKILIKRQKQQC